MPGREFLNSQSAEWPDLNRQYAALGMGPAIVDRSYRGTLEITGANRSVWLHNLLTNHVRTLNTGQGNYAFALNVRGRILFDLNIFARPESLWVELDRRFAELAKGHFAKYTITEDVRLTDLSDQHVHIGLAGENAVRLLGEMGAGHAGTMTLLQLSNITWSDLGSPMTVARTDFCGPKAWELFVGASDAEKVWRWLTNESRRAPAVPASTGAVEVRRIEAGIPWPGFEITDEYLPAETRQLERAVSFTKGCYLGQEVVERMRSRDVVARLLVGLQIEGTVIPPRESPVLDSDGKTVGKLTSTCHSLAKGSVIGLGYVKTAVSDPGRRLRLSWSGGQTSATVVALPFVLAPGH